MSLLKKSQKNTFIVDAFHEGKYLGNPAAVCVLEREPAEAEMQALAAEFNLSETAFAVKSERDWKLRWFTPLTEVALCGHATLATAYSLWHNGFVPRREKIRFQTKSGVLTAELRKGSVYLDFPLKHLTPISAGSVRNQLEKLFPGALYFGEDSSVVYIELSDAAEVLSFVPDASSLLSIPFIGVVLTSVASEARFDFVTRCFYPKEGIPEDPVTGSAHCRLGSYWSLKLKKTTLVAHQASRRGGVLHLNVNPDSQRIELGGRGRTFLVGTLSSAT